MRILVVTPWFPTQSSPQSGLFVAREAAALAGAHDVRVLHLDWTGSPDDRTADPGSDVRRVVLRRSRPADFARARRIVRRAAADADVVHTHALTVLLPWLIGRPTRGTWVHSEHWSGLTAPETLTPGERALLPLLRRVLRRPQVVVAESSRLAQAIRRSRRGATEIVPCVVPAVPIRPWPDGLRLIGIGGMVPRKGPLIAVEALAALRARGHDAALTWVGDGPQRAEVDARATELGVRAHLDLAGILPARDVSARLAGARMLLLPTAGDNFCVVAAEALVSGRVVVSGAATGAVDYAGPEVSRFVASTAPADYADAVESLLSATGSMTPDGVAATVAGRFDPEVVRAALERIYGDVAAVAP